MALSGEARRWSGPRRRLRARTTSNQETTPTAAASDGITRTEESMARGLNHVTLAGMLVQDPEMRYTPSGKPAPSAA